LWSIWSINSAEREQARPKVKTVVSIVPFTIMNYVVTGTDEELLRQKADYKNGSEPVRLDLIEPDSEGAAYYFDPAR